MNVELKPIAESKVRQLGGDVCGVLVRNEAGAWAAVSEGGRVVWLDDFEGQPASAQGGQGADVVAWECSGEPGLYDNITRSKGEADHHRKIGRTVRPLVYGDTHPQPAQQGSVPEDVIRQCEDAIQYASEIKGGCISGVREAQKRIRAILDTPQPAVPEGWKLVPIEPSDGMIQAGIRADNESFPLHHIYKAMLASAPQPPKEGEGDA